MDGDDDEGIVDYQQDESDQHNPGTVDDILNHIGYGPLQALAFALAGMTAMAFGLEMVVFAFLALPIQQHWNVTSVEYAVLPAMTGLGNLIGGVVYGVLCDHYGRVWPYALILTHVGVVGLASSLSETFYTLVALRTVVSVAITGASTIMFSTLVEFLPVRNRGKIMVAVLVIESLGISAMAGMAWWLVSTYPLNGWRYVLVAASVPYFIPAAFRLLFSMQSPRFLMAQGRYKEAEAVFRKMARINGKEVPSDLLNQKNIQQLVELDASMSPRTGTHSRRGMLLAFCSMFKPPHLRTTLCLSIIFVTETASYFSMSTFLPSVLEEYGMDPYFVSFMGYVGQIPGILLMSIVVEWRGVGRLNSLRVFTLLTVLSFALLASVCNKAAMAVSVILIYFSMVPIISLLYTYMSEIYPTQFRTFALGFFTNLSAATGMFLPYVSGYLAGVKIHWLFPTVWGAVFLVQFVVSLFLNIETLGRNLSDKVL